MASIAPILVLSNKAEGEKPAETRELIVIENTNLKKQVATLTQENEALTRENTELKRKRKSVASSLEAPTTKKAKTPAQRKKLFEKWAKAAARESAKTKLTNSYSGDQYTAIVKETMPWTPEAFQDIFDGKGVKIQPTPENKPTSKITILNFSSHEDIKDLFGGGGEDAQIIAFDGYKVQAWRQRNFCRTIRVEDRDTVLENLAVHYNKSKQTLQLHFKLEVMAW